jgi:glycyl-tRNA synthetase beta chain
MGKYYAQHAGEAESVALACSEHYKPLGPSDTTPSDLVSVVVSLADKVDLLSGFWSIDEKPTGSKDPFALRRAALGVIRLILENSLHCDLNQILSNAFKLHPSDGAGAQESLVHFILERLKVYLRDKNIRHDVIDACLDEDIETSSLDIRLFVQRVEAVSAMIHTAHGKEFLAMTKRVVNILKAEEDKDGVEYTLDPDSKFFETEQEKTLLAQVQTVRPEFLKAFKAYDFGQSIQALFVLKDPLNQFFDAVIVNSDNSIVRRNRLCLLNIVRQLTQKIANLEKVSD